MDDTEIIELARRIAYRYFDQEFDADPETLARIVEDEIKNAVATNAREFLK